MRNHTGRIPASCRPPMNSKMPMNQMNQMNHSASTMLCVNAAGLTEQVAAGGFSRERDE